ncbi:MAG: TssA family type VI secretion system protein [Polyangiales bacterium]
MPSELAQPLDGPSVSGIDVRHEPEHELIRAQIAKLDGVSGEPPDWPLIEQHGATLLATRSKDLTIAAYVAAAGFERSQWEGLSAGCALLADLVSGFGEALYPRRSRARANALRWWTEHVTARISSLPKLDAAHLERTSSLVSRLRQSAQDWLGDEAPPFGELLRALEGALAHAPVSPPTPSLPPAEPELPSDEAGIARYLRVQGGRLIQLARARRQLDARDARAYRWLRNGLWLSWDSAPPDTRSGRTAVPAPLPTPRAELEHAREQGRWLDVVNACEALLELVPHWLDLGFVCAHALRELGPEYVAAHDAVERETRALHARLPELVMRSFRDGTAFASPATSQWLLGTQAAREPARPVVVPVEDSLEGVMHTLREAPSPRALFVQRCRLAQGFLAGGDAERARFVYLGLLADVDALALERWEPALVVEVVQALSTLNEGRTPGGVKDAERADLYVRLARLAPWSPSKRGRS